MDEPRSDPPAGPPKPDLRPVERLLGTSRFLVVLAVVGSFIASATLMIYGLLRALGIIADLIPLVNNGLFTDPKWGKELIGNTIALIDMFLLGTVLFIVSVGLYQLFVDTRVALPRWLQIRTLDDLKTLLTGVIIVALLVAFLGSAVTWKTGDGNDILAYGLAVAATVFVANIAMRTFSAHGRRPPDE